MDQGRLIELVRQYDHIYKKKHKDFKNKLARDNAWNTISSIMGYPREKVETAWNSLRNRFATERRKLRCVPTGSAASTEWRFFQALSFLEEHIAVRKTVGNIETSRNLWDTELLSQQTIESEKDFCIIEDVMDSVDQSNPSQSISQLDESLKSISEHKENINEMKQYKRKRNDVTSLEKSIVATLGTIENILKNPNEEEDDEDHLFSRCVGKSLRQIKSRKLKARAKLEILSVLEKYEED